MNFTKKQIESLLKELGHKLLQDGVIGEIGIVGGAAMVLAYAAREATRDVDAVFKPAALIRAAVKQIAAEHDLPEDWLNDGVKGFMPGTPALQTTIIDVPGLRAWVPEPQYMLAMKAMSARVDSKDTDDLRFLIKFLKIKSPDVVFDLIKKYYPDSEIPVKTQYFVQELCNDLKNTGVRRKRQR